MLYEAGSKHYTICALLNNCFFDKGNIRLAKHKSSGSLVAIKHFNLEELMEEEYKMVIDEILRMRQLKHPNIICCLTSYVMSADLYIISPFMNFTSCYQLLTTHFGNGLPEVVISLFFRDILRALDYIHSKGYIHRAVKARHILVHVDGHACLSGLRYMYPVAENKFRQSLTKSVYHFPLHASHNLNWASPELLEQNLHGYDQKSDVYSVGVTACELANGVVPFAETSTTLMLTEKMRGVTPQLIDCTTWFLYEEDGGDGASSRDDLENSVGDIASPPRENIKMCRRFSDSFHAFVELCSHRNTNIRPTPAQLLNHFFIKRIRRTNVDVQELLRPAVPFTENNTAELNEDVATFDDLSHNFTNTSVHSKEWDF